MKAAISRGIPDNEFLVIANKLKDDLESNMVLFDAIGSNPKLAKAWGKIADHPQLRVDIDVLGSLSKALDDDYLKTLILMK